MLAIHRARQILLLSVTAVVVLVLMEFPLHQLMAQRAQIGATAAALAAVEQHNSALSGDITALAKSSVIASIAHQDYGLVAPGQRSYVILPAAGSTIGADPLSAASIPVTDIGSSTGSGNVPPAAAVHQAPVGSLWSRMVAHLEFWH